MGQNSNHTPSGFDDFLGDMLAFFKYLVLAVAAAALVMYSSGVTI